MGNSSDTNTTQSSKNQQKTSSKTYNFFHQVLVLAIILLISKMIENAVPVPMPASVVGLVLLFIALCTGIVKLGEVESVGTALTNNIGFLFVPAGISVINSLDALSTSPILIILMIIVSTILLLLCTGFVSQFFMTKLTKREHKPSHSTLEDKL